MLRKKLVTTIIVLLALFLNHNSNANFLLRTKEFMHRGVFHPSQVENHVHTILNNIKNGFDYFEVDVKITKDNQLILFHDEKIGRVLEAPSNYATNSLTLQEIQSYSIKKDPTGKLKVCTAKQLFDSLLLFIQKNPHREIMFEIDFKPSGSKGSKGLKQLLQIIKKAEDKIGHRIYDHFFISSFYPKILKQINKHNSDIKKALGLINNPAHSKLSAKLAIWLAPYFVRRYDVDIIEPNICMINEDFVRKWHRRKCHIITYTANTLCEKKYIKKFPIAFITDCVDNNCGQQPNDGIGRPKKWCKKCKD